ncbi:MAG: hypothetical protein J6Q33_00125 [Alistipes sp.]|nr:hypothetical protein [Alistipes sp.]
MKNLLKVASFALLALVVAACADKEASTPTASIVPDTEVGFSLPMDATRTSIDPADGRTTRWVEGDKLAVWAKSGDGSYAFENAIFTLRYFSTEWDKAYFTSGIAAMGEGDYTYLLSYPQPKAVEGTLATYSVAAVQSGKYDGVHDIMIAEPVVAGALTAESKVELNTVMRHQMHALKIVVPEKSSNFSDRVYSLEVTFPNPVVGDIIVDVANPNAEPTYANTSNTIVVNSNEGFAVGSDIWVFVLPGTVSGDVSYKVKGLEQRSEVATYQLERTFAAGHITPIRMAMPPFDKYTVLNFSIGANYLGEDFNYFTLYDNNGVNRGTFNRNSENRYAVEFFGEFDAAAYNNTNWTLVFDTENAVVENKVNLGTLKPYFQQNIAPVDVPYLLFENFDSATEKESYGNNSYSSSEREQPGVSLDGAMPTNGWNAARFWLKPGAIRVNSRYQSVKIFVSFASSHHGRVDTPPLGNGTRGLKAGKSVNVKLHFDAALYKHKSSSLSLKSGAINVATHTNHSNPINGIPTGSTGISSSYDTTLADFGTTFFNQTLADNASDNAFGQSFPTYSTELPVSSDTRICFYPTLSTASGTGNTEVNVYLDNIKVSIVK